MRITLVAGVARNGVIGADGGLPWRLPEDLQHFKAVTMGHTMVMGRRTFDSIGRALPGRRTIVVTRDPQWTAAGVQTAASVPEALQLAAAESAPATDTDGVAADGVAAEHGAAEHGAIMVVGGGEIYAATMPLADRLEITHVDAEVDGDTYFPAIAPAEWERVRLEQHDGFAFAGYRRRPAGPVTDLPALLAGLDPELHPGEFVFGTLADAARPPAEWKPVATIAEAEGLTVVLAAAQAEQARVDGLLTTGPETDRWAWITLRVQSALQAVGLTGAVATALAADGIACNVIAGAHHDHLFVPADRAHDALACLAALGHLRA